MFLLIGQSSQEMGVTYTMMIIKLSVVVPTLLSIVVFADPMTPLRWSGVGLALVAIVLLHLRYRKTSQLAAGQSWRKIIGLSIVLFLGSGAIDTLFKIFYERYNSLIPANIFIMTLFGVAALAGVILVGIRLLQGHQYHGWQNWIAGAALGIPNYFSILTLLFAIRILPGTVFFPVNNIGQLLLTSLVGLVVYREYMPRLSQLGMGLAILAIFLIAYEHLGPYIAPLFP
jgi:drug/metabolite transporter (DMT)-like permease